MGRPLVSWSVKVAVIEVLWPAFIVPAASCTSTGVGAGPVTWNAASCTYGPKLRRARSAATKELVSGHPLTETSLKVRPVTWWPAL